MKKKFVFAGLLSAVVLLAAGLWIALPPSRSVPPKPPVPAPQAPAPKVSGGAVPANPSPAVPPEKRVSKAPIIVENAETLSVDLDFPAMNPTIRTARFVELLRSPKTHAGRTIRLAGQSVDVQDSSGKTHYGIAVYDQGGCCPLATIEYVPGTTDPPLPRGKSMILAGAIEVPAQPVYSPFVVVGAIFLLESL